MHAFEGRLAIVTYVFGEGIMAMLAEGLARRGMQAVLDIQAEAAAHGGAYLWGQWPSVYRRAGRCQRP